MKKAELFLVAEELKLETTGTDQGLQPICWTKIDPWMKQVKCKTKSYVSQHNYPQTSEKLKQGGTRGTLNLPIAAQTTPHRSTQVDNSPM